MIGVHQAHRIHPGRETTTTRQWHPPVGLSLYFAALDPHIADQHVKIRNAHGQDHDKHTRVNKIDKRDVVSLVGRDTRSHNVGRSSKQSTIASEASTKGQGPGKRLEGESIGQLIGKDPNDWNHSGRVWNIIQETGGEGADPKKESNCNSELLVFFLTRNVAGQGITNSTEQAHSRADLHKNKLGLSERGLEAHAMLKNRTVEKDWKTWAQIPDLVLLHGRHLELE